MDLDKEKIEFLIAKSKEILKEQSDSFVSTHNKSAILITMLAIFIPLFFDALKDANCIIKYISILPFILISISVILLMKILKPKQIYYGFKSNELDNLINKTKDEIYMFELQSNISAKEANEKIVEIQNKIFIRGLNFSIVAIVFSMLLLLTNLILTIYT